MISGSTRLAGVIGDPVRHSLSPAIHNAGFAALGLDWVYVALPVPAGGGAAAVDAMRTLGVDGLSVTMPHKADVATGVDELTPVAAALGVCNCLYRVDGTDRIAGHSTDGDGFVAAFRSRFGRDLAGLSILVVGAGGAARSIIEAVGRAWRRSHRRGQSHHRTGRAGRRLASTASAVAMADLGPSDVASVDVVVNTTAVGMAGGPAPGRDPGPGRWSAGRAPGRRHRLSAQGHPAVVGG